MFQRICFRGRHRKVRGLFGGVALILLILWYTNGFAIQPEVQNRPELVERKHVDKYVGLADENWKPKHGKFLPHGITGGDIMPPFEQETSCKPNTNVVYIKEIKCASQTLTSIFRRFGYERNLSFVLPVANKIYLGWPYLIEEEYYRPKKTAEYNILCEHSVFDDKRMREIMPEDTVFVTSLRESFAQFQSMFNYYNFLNILKLANSSDPVGEYLRNIDKHEKMYISHAASPLRHCIPDGFSMSRNLMSYVLGFPRGFLPDQPDMTQDDAFIDDWLTDISNEFSLVMITEYFHESLILLKRLMCWDFRDIIYLNQNVGMYQFKTNVDRKLAHIYQKHSNVDHVLYDKFNRTFWEKISTLGQDFTQEVKHFDSIISDVTTFCAGVNTRETLDERAILQIYPSRWSTPFSVDRNLCKLMSDSNVLELIKDKYDHQLPDLQQPKPQKTFC